VPADTLTHKYGGNRKQQNKVNESGNKSNF